MHRSLPVTGGPVSERLIWTILYGSANIRSLLRRYPGRSQLYFGEPYGNFLEGDECEENDDGISYAKRYVRIEIDPPALEKADPLPTIEKLEEENNEWVKFTIQENDQVVTEERDGGEEFDG